MKINIQCSNKTITSLDRENDFYKGNEQTDQIVVSIEGFDSTNYSPALSFKRADGIVIGTIAPDASSHTSTTADDGTVTDSFTFTLSTYQGILSVVGNLDITVWAIKIISTSSQITQIPQRSVLGTCCAKVVEGNTPEALYVLDTDGETKVNIITAFENFAAVVQNMSAVVDGKLDESVYTNFRKNEYDPTKEMVKDHELRMDILDGGEDYVGPASGTPYGKFPGGGVVQKLIDGKVDKVDGYGLSENNYDADAVAKVAAALNADNLLSALTTLFNANNYTFFSSTDKANLNVLVALLGESSGDSNKVVDTIREVLDIFNYYPEGTTIVNALAAKVNTTDFNTYKTSNDTAVGKKADKTTTDSLDTRVTALEALTDIEGTGSLAKILANCLLKTYSDERTTEGLEATVTDETTIEKMSSSKATRAGVKRTRVQTDGFGTVTEVEATYNDDYLNSDETTKTNDFEYEKTKTIKGGAVTIFKEKIETYQLGTDDVRSTEDFAAEYSIQVGNKSANTLDLVYDGATHVATAKWKGKNIVTEEQASDGNLYDTNGYGNFGWDTNNHIPYFGHYIKKYSNMQLFSANALQGIYWLGNSSETDYPNIRDGSAQILRYNHELNRFCINDSPILTEANGGLSYHNYHDTAIIHPVASSVLRKGFLNLIAGKSSVDNTVKLADYEWTTSGSNTFVTTVSLSPAPIGNSSGAFIGSCTKYTVSTGETDNLTDKTIGIGGSSGKVFIRDNSYSTASEFKASLGNTTLTYRMASILINAPQYVKSVSNNLIDSSKFVANYYVRSTTGDLVSSSASYATDFIPVVSGWSIYFSGMTSNNAGNTGAYYDSNKNYICAIDRDSDIQSGVVPAGACYIRLSLFLSHWNSIYDAMLNYGTTALSFVEHSENTQSLENEESSVATELVNKHSWDSTIASQWLGLGIDSTNKNYMSFENGKAVIKYAKATLNGSENWILYNENLFTNYFDSIAVKNSNSLSDCHYTLQILSGSSATKVTSNGAYTVDAWKTYLSNNPITVIYELVTPIEIDLTDLQDCDVIQLIADGSVMVLDEEGNPFEAELDYDYITGKVSE